VQGSAILFQADTQAQEPWADNNGKPDKSNSSDGQVAKVKEELTTANKK
jgi:hypothetical protein